ncbi:hypothetical protein N9X40_03080 [bacterium]|nr:hypothetical protein [bacterium]
MKIRTPVFVACALFVSLLLQAAEQWQFVDTKGELTKRHEAGFVESDGKFYLMGGAGFSL